MYSSVNQQASTNTATNTYRFYGLNRQRKGSKGEMEDMVNMTSAEYPCAAPAPSRETVAASDTDIQAATAPDSSVSDAVDGLTGVTGGCFYYNGVKKSGRAVLDTSYAWTIERLRNVYIINGIGSGKAIFTYDIDTDEFAPLIEPMDKLILTAGEDTHGCYLETIRYLYTAVDDHAVTLDDGTTMSGSDFYDKYRSYRAEDNIFEAYFSVDDQIEISGFPPAGGHGRLWYYNGGSGDGGDLVPVTNFDVTINNTVDTSFQRMADIDRDAIVLARVKDFSVTLAGGRYAHRIYFELRDKTGAENEFLAMTGLGTNNANYYAQGVTLKKSCPAFSDIAVHHERLWGTTPNGESVYASSAADISDFTADSINKGYAARLNPDIPGEFTGICEYGSYVLAFKESAIVLIYGSDPKSYKSETIRGIGCIDQHSIAVTPSGVIFLSYNGFYIYDGSVPKLISAKLNTRYSAAFAGFDGRTYYASATRADGDSELLAYDMQYGLWHVRDSFTAVGMFRFRGGFYFAGQRGIYTETGMPEEWNFTLARTTDNTLNDKAVNELWIYADVADGASFSVSTSAGNGDFASHARFYEPGLNVFRCPVRARSGTHYRIRFSGEGSVVFHEIEVKKGDTTARRFKDYEGTIPAV